MTTLKDVQTDKLKQAALYLDEISDVESEEFWRLFIDELPQKIYTEDQIETFAEAGNTTTGSPSFKLLCDLRDRGLAFKTFIKCLETIKCTKAFNFFTQTTIPVILEHPSSQSLQCGDVLLLRCRGGCVPSPPQYQWYWNDTPLLDQTDSVLKISDVNTSHTGYYKCIVTNPYINDHGLNCFVISHTVKVEVLKYPLPEANAEPYLYPEYDQSENESRIRSGSPPSVIPRYALYEANKDIEIIVQPLNLECRYNETFQLECIAMSQSGKPITYKWIRKKPGRSVTLHSEERFNNSVLSYSWRKHDILIFYCAVSTDGFVTEVVSDEAKVTVHSIWFEHQPEPVYGHIGQYALLYCEAVGKGPIQYLWLKNESDRKVKVHKGFMENGVLEFPSLQVTHCGQYICQAQNEEELVSSNVVTVECEPKKKAKNLRIVTQPKSYVCARDDSVTLTCEAVSMREICYQWYHDDKELRNETMDTLILSSINDLQFGSYHCVVTSGDESVTSDKANVVFGLPIDSSKTINQPQTDRFDVPEKPIPLLSTYDSRGSTYDKLKDNVMFLYSVNKDDEISVKEGDIVNVITMEMDVNKPEKRLLLRFLSSITDKWQEIGDLLGVDRCTIEELCHSHFSDQVKMSKMLQSWLDNEPTPVTWDNVISILKGPLQEKSLALEICQFFSKESEKKQEIQMLSEEEASLTSQLKKNKEVGKETVSVQTELMELSVNKQDVSVQFNYLIPSNDALKGVYIVGETLFIIQGDSLHFLNWEQYGLKITVPEGALSPADTSEVALRALVGGQFQLPKDTELVSGVYAFSVSKPLLKPVKLEIQHCAHLVTKDHASYLSFITASIQQSSLPYKFQLQEGGQFYPGDQYGRISLPHFCLKAIVKSRTDPFWSGIVLAQEIDPFVQSANYYIGGSELGEVANYGVHEASPRSTSDLSSKTSDEVHSKTSPVCLQNNSKIAFNDEVVDEVHPCTLPKLPPLAGNEFQSEQEKGGSPDNDYVGQVVYENRKNNQGLTRFMAAKHLNILIEIRKSEVDKYGAENPPSVPSVLITITADSRPNTVTQLIYCVPLKGITPDDMELYLIRSFEDMSTTTFEPNETIPAQRNIDGTLNSDVARRALLKCTRAIVESTIEPISLAMRLVEEEVISEDVYKIIKDKKTGATGTERLDMILDDVKDHVKVNANAFLIFLDTLRDDSLNRQDLANKIIKINHSVTPFMIPRIICLLCS